MAPLSKPFTKVCIILLSFFIAIVLLSITNILLAHVHIVATTILFPTKTNNNAIITTKPSNVGPKTKTVYVEPTEEDLELIRQEVDASEPLPPIDKTAADEVARIQSIITSTESLLAQREKQSGVAQTEIDELNDAYASFENRLEQDTTSSSSFALGIDDATAKEFELKLPYLRELMGRKSYIDLDRKSMMELFDGALDELSWLLSSDEEDDYTKKLISALFINTNGILMKSINTVTNNSASSECEKSYLVLDKDKVSAELASSAASGEPISHKAKADTKVVVNEASITEDTARESDLYELVQTIKHTLSRRDLASVKLDENNEVLPDPISAEGLDAIRGNILPVVKSIEEKRKLALGQEDEIREQWMEKMKHLKAALVSATANDDGESSPLCASPVLVKDMVATGLETFRGKGDLRSALVSVALLAVEEDGEATFMLRSELEKITVPEINYSSDDQSPEDADASSSSWKTGKRSISYAVDGPLLQVGVVGCIDYFVDSVSGYNDHVDALLDWFVGDEGGSAGTNVVDAISKVIRKLPFPLEFVGRMKKSGILAGRMRSLLED